MKIHEAAENYLETILVLLQSIQKVRMIDIANKMHYSKPTVSVVLKEFREDGYILTDEHGYITLTTKGQAIAKRIYERHLVLTEFLISIGVDEETASADACKMEHDISDKTFQCIKNLYSKQIK